MTEYLLATAETSTAYQTGRSVGVIFFGILIVLGLIKAIKTIFGARGNAKCGSALGLILLVYGVSLMCVRARESGSLPPGMERYIGWFFLAAVPIAFVLAVWGIVEFHTHRDAYDHGQGQAILTIVLIVITGAIAIPNFLRARAFVMARKASLTSTGTNAPGAPLVYREYGFTFKPPEKPWVEFNAKKFNPDATLGFTRFKPPVFFMIIAESAGEYKDLTLDAVVEVIKIQMNGQGKSGRLLKETALRRAGIDGIQLEREGRISKGSFYFVQWVAVHKSYVYQLCCWGEISERALVQRESEQLFNRFELLDANPWAGLTEVKPQYAPAKAPRGKEYYKSDRFHYAVDLSNSDWTVWPNENRELADADIGASHQSGAKFALIPICLMEQRPSQEVLRRAFAGPIRVKASEMKERQRVMQKHFQGAEYEGRTTNGNIVSKHYLRIVEGKDYAYAFQVWAPKDAPKLDMIWTDLLDRVDLLVPLEETAKQWSERDKKVQRQFFTTVAAIYQRSGETEKSKIYTEIANQFAPMQSAKAAP